MKNLILFLFVFCSTFASAQISIPNVTGLPAALNSKEPKVTGKSLVADTLVTKIQPHMVNFSNPHSVTKAQVGLGNVDNTSDANKPISTATQTALDGKQPVGTYATGTGTANGTNTGDETLTSIKTKLGAASSANSGYLENTDWTKFNTSYTSRIQSTESPLYFTAGTIGCGYSSVNSNGLLSSTDWNTFNSKQNALSTNQSTVLSNLTGINYNVIPKSTAGGYSNSLISDNGSGVSIAGTISATNLSNSNSGDETQATIKDKLGFATTSADGYLKYADWNTFNGKQNSLTIGNLTSTTNGFAITNGANAVIGTGTAINISTATAGSGGILTSTDWNRFNDKEPAFSKNTGFNKNFGTTTGTVLEGRTFGTAANSATGDFQPTITGLTTNYIPKWNGSSFVNSLVSDNGSTVTIGYASGGASRRLQLTTAGGGDDGQLLLGQYSTSRYWTLGRENISAGNFTLKSAGDDGVEHLWMDVASGNGNTKLYSTTASTSPTTGALVVNGGLGADHVRANNFYGSGSSLTGVQMPITLTTTGTSGVATFSGNILNVPNYSSSIVDQVLNVVGGSVSGEIVGSMPFQTPNYKKVIVYVNFMSGDATYTFPTTFNTKYTVTTNNLGSSYTSLLVAGSYMEINGATSSAGVIIIEGY